MGTRRSRNWIRGFVFTVLLLLVGIGSVQADTLRIADWNIYNRPNSSADNDDFVTILEAMAAETIQGYAGQVDIMALAETDTSSFSTTISLFNATYSGSYAGVSSTASAGGDRTGIIYDTTKVTLISSQTISGVTNPGLLVLFRPVGTNGEADFYVVSLHLKSGTSSSDEAQRASEIATIRELTDSLGENAAIIYAGDFNWTSSDETTTSAYDLLTAEGNGQAIDVVGAGDYRDNVDYIEYHTQDPGGSMDDRFDAQLYTDEFFDGEGIDYVEGSYHVFGNNGTHTLNGTILTGDGASDEVLQALVSISDHLPVIADFTIVPESCTLLLLIPAGSIVILRRRHKAKAAA